MSKVNHKWLANVENPEEFEKKLIEQKELFKRFYAMIYEKAKANYDNQIKKSNYDSASWSERQADAIGYNRCLEEMMALLKYTQE